MGVSFLNIKKVQAVLGSFLTVKGVEGCGLFSVEGLPIHVAIHSSGSSRDEEKLAAMTAALLSIGESVVEEMRKGILEFLYTKGDGGYIVCRRVLDTILTAITTDDIKLGLLFHEIEIVARELEDSG